MATKMMNGRECQWRQIPVVPPADDQVGPKLLEERYDQPSRVQAVCLQCAERGAHGDRRQKLIQQLGPRCEPEIAAMHDLEVIVRETDGGKGKGRHHRNPHEAVGQVGPQQRGYQHSDHDQHPAHGRCTGFLLVGLGAVFANVLTDLKFTQPAHHRGTDDEPDE